MSRHQTLLCRYHYDPLDRVAGQITADEADSRLFYQKSRLSTQIQGALYCSVLQADDQLLAQQQSGAKIIATTLLATDQQRSVLQSMDGGQRDASAYTAYGHLPLSSGLNSLLGFDGERRDLMTGHYSLGNGYRAFNPVLMRFNSPDSLSPFAEGGLNAYAYCQGDPVNYRDPTGQAPFASIFTRTWMLRPIELKRSTTALQLPRVNISPPRVTGPSISKGQAISVKAGAPVKNNALLKQTLKAADVKTLMARSRVRSASPAPLPIERPQGFSYRQEDFRMPELKEYLGIQEPSAAFVSVQKLYLLSPDDVAKAVKAVRS